MMTTKDNILKFLKEEKELSEYKIGLLKSGEQKPYKLRLISKEQEFINFDFLSLPIASLDEIRDAVLLFKSSREDFDKKFFPIKQNLFEKISSTDIHLMNEKISFLESKCKWILESKIKEINIIDNMAIRSLLPSEPKNIELLTPGQIKKIEGSLIGKHRGRIQILLYCLAKYLYKNIVDLKNILNKDNIIYSDLLNFNANINSIFLEYNKNIYKYFNLAMVDVKSILHSTNGYNFYIDSIHPLKNIVPQIDSFKIMKLINSENILNENGSLVKKRSVERSFGINTGIKRVGNESIEILSLSIYLDDGTEISDLFEKNFSNILINNDYIKSISTIPINNLLDIVIKRGLQKYFNNYFIDGNTKINISSINSGNITGPNLSKIDSAILVAETRSDMEHLIESEKTLSILIGNIKKEFEEKFNFLIKEDTENFSRKEKIQKFLE